MEKERSLEIVWSMIRHVLYIIREQTLLKHILKLVQNLAVNPRLFEPAWAQHMKPEEVYMCAVLNNTLY